MPPCVRGLLLRGHTPVIGKLRLSMHIMCSFFSLTCCVSSTLLPTMRSTDHDHRSLSVQAQAQSQACDAPESDSIHILCPNEQRRECQWDSYSYSWSAAAAAMRSLRWAKGRQRTRCHKTSQIKNQATRNSIVNNYVLRSSSPCDLSLQ